MLERVLEYLFTCASEVIQEHFVRDRALESIQYMQTPSLHYKPQMRVCNEI